MKINPNQLNLFEEEKMKINLDGSILLSLPIKNNASIKVGDKVSVVAGHQVILANKYTKIIGTAIEVRTHSNKQGSAIVKLCSL